MTKKILYPPEKRSAGDAGSPVARLARAALPLALVLVAYYAAQAIFGG